MATASQISTDPALETRFFWEEHKWLIVGVVLLLAVAGLGYTAYQVYTARQAATAANALASAQTPEQFQQVIAQYPGSQPAASAYLLLAAAQRAKRDFAGAADTLRKFIEQFPKHEMITTAWMGIAANQQSLGKNDEALASYQRVSTEFPQSYNAPLALLAQVPLLKAKNKMEDARHICETVLSQYRDSIVANEAFRELMSLPRPAATPTIKAMAAPSQIPMQRPPETATPAAKP